MAADTDTSATGRHDVPVGIIGAGTMGEGIAQVAAVAGHQVQLFDTNAPLVQAAIGRIEQRLKRAVEKGRLTATAAAAAIARIDAVGALAGLAGAGLVVEAIKEDLGVKREVFAQLEEVVGDDAILTSNTSSLSITALAATLRRKGRFAGLHFFNPAPLMALVEIVPGLDSNPEVLDTLHALMRQWGKSPVYAPCVPGFIVNRVARPFYAEALEVLGEGAAPVAAIDRAIRGAGYAMGPFELMDMIGHDVNFAVTSTVFNATFGDARYRPSPIQQELVASGRLGRKSGRGFYRYGDNAEDVASAPAAAAQPRRPERIESGDTALRTALRGAGLEVIERDELGGWTLVDGIALAMTDGTGATLRQAPDGRSDVVLHDLVLDWSAGGAVAVAAAEVARPDALAIVANLFAWLGRDVVSVGDVAGLVVARTVAMLVAEGAEAVARGVAAGEVDLAMRLGAGHRTAPLQWCDAIGAATFVNLLDKLEDHYRDTRHRVPPLLRRMAATGRRFHTGDTER
ncbi:MAG: 3-hydroxyacyl-CoA dehydrogenase [Gammaproteobacteria bacterium]|nr:3-hydroxyacyl-CoA dehydrogenase [Gammaproteobacteria bacterium]